MSKSGWKKRLAGGLVVAILAGGSVFAWRELHPAGLPDNFAARKRCRVVDRLRQSLRATNCDTLSEGQDFAVNTHFKPSEEWHTQRARHRRRLLKNVPEPLLGTVASERSYKRL